MPADETSIDSLIRAAARAPSVPPARSGRAVRVGDLIGGNFRLEAELGRGGMGVVYRAIDLTLDRQVALKIMLAERWPVEARSRLLEIFDREARATAKLSHPAIVHLYQSGDDNGLLYLVLELLRGENLQTRLERGLPGSTEAVEIVEQILRGLAHAHEQGILHRDLKPQNVFVCDDGRVRLLDFGLAALQDRVAERGVDQVEILSRGGTPSYMAPEQWSGQPQDERTDLWAVGMILYRLVSVASILPPASVDELRVGVALDEVEPRLAAVIRRATAFAPADRFPSARAMLAALVEGRGLALGSQPAAHPPPAPAPARRWLSRRALAASLGVVAVVGAALAGWRWWSAPPLVTLAELAGIYRSQVDQLVLQVNPDGSLWGTYQHDEGFLQARLVDGKLVGWWCEVPTRQAPADAGELEMQLIRQSDGTLLLDGRYRYGRAGQWDENWNLTSTSAPANPELVRRLTIGAPPCAPAR